MTNIVIRLVLQTTEIWINKSLIEFKKYERKLKFIAYNFYMSTVIFLTEPFGVSLDIKFGIALIFKIIMSNLITVKNLKKLS